MESIIKKCIKEFLKDKKGISFAEIDSLLEDNDIDYEGNSAIFFNKEYNWIVWSGISKDYMNAILELENEGIANLSQCEPIIYYVDGIYMNYPIVRRKIKYKEPHWLPCSIK